MASLVWLNGEVIPMAEARIGVEDRGFQFADGVYEVIRIYRRKPFALTAHLQRLERSAAAISLKLPLAIEALDAEIRKFLARQDVQPECAVYMQVTRGVAPRNHAFAESSWPTLLFYTIDLSPPAAVGTEPGVKLLAVADERWKRCWIKSIALLPNVLAKNQALASGADEAVFIDEGKITECSVSNFFLISGGRLITHPAGPKVLPGITRSLLLDLAASVGLSVEQRPPLEAEAETADELLITSTTREISWVSHWNDRAVAPGHCGPWTLKLHRALRDKILRETE